MKIVIEVEIPLVALEISPLEISADKNYIMEAIRDDQYSIPVSLNFPDSVGTNLVITSKKLDSLEQLGLSYLGKANRSKDLFHTITNTSIGKTLLEVVNTIRSTP